VAALAGWSRRRDQDGVPWRKIHHPESQENVGIQAAEPLLALPNVILASFVTTSQA
jgi:hypothetical protein